MKTSDGRIITGICKEKDTAREEYEHALTSGKFAGLLEYVTDDCEYQTLLSRGASLSEILSQCLRSLWVPYLRMRLHKSDWWYVNFGVLSIT